MNINIRQATVNDAAQLLHIATTTFTEAFAAQNTEEDLRDYLQKHLYLEKIREELEHPGATFFLAFDGEDLIGYTKLNSGAAQTEPQGDDALEIERIYILAAYYGKDVGRQLLDTGFRYARDKGYKKIWLGVWEENQRALAFYKKEGFEAFGEHVFMLGASKQTDMLMQRMLA